MNSIHSWTEVPFRNSGEVCCAFRDDNDYFLNLDTGSLAVSLPLYVATNVNLTNGVSFTYSPPHSLLSLLTYLHIVKESNVCLSTLLEKTVDRRLRGFYHGRPKNLAILCRFHSGIMRPLQSAQCNPWFTCQAAKSAPALVRADSLHSRKQMGPRM